MAEEASPREIAEILRKELSDKWKLAPLDEKTVERIRNYFKSLQEKIEKLRKISNPMIEKEIKKLEMEMENMRKIVEKIFKERFRKGVYLALAASESNPKLLLTEGMLEEERKLFKEIAEKLYEVREKIINFITKDLKEVPQTEESKVLVRILEDIEEFVWEDGNIYGPFKKEDLVELPKDVVEILHARRKVEVIR